ncbi:PEP-CTERM-box response regulator transcription factor [Thiohalobacter thiocyanaticus]|uniref:PEP-CTERM-box response regulator transcription factor n=1 Tax=Thiohalobacter thiocyanaticus TaxID=585455 RepID=A0A426QIR4_9GAMM|nr:PEP-CTERM-box response regulator transcription factor [Thiohalobacter thiocyanaticus]RRQ21630.1 PEP-CTERM-box response regulator transcription factor [Thiohalobacter thiocyanaticus]
MTDESKKLLVVEDDPGLQTQLKWCFDDYEVIIAGDREAALAELRKHPFPVMTLDLGLPPDDGGTSEGFATLEQVLNDYPETKVIVVTGNNERENALRAVGLGAYDFFYKPIDSDLLGFIVNRAYRLHELEEENTRLHTRRPESPLEGVLTGSEEMMEVCRTVEKVAPADVSVLVLGDSGTGKELMARSLHGLSRRNDGPFIAINCAAIPENLLESELFGYEKGAFTGAVKTTPGKIETAHGGTLFLDEVGDLPMPLQAKLLRFLQERTIERVGGRKEIPVDVRVLCATHKDLQQLIRDDDFREDLYYRISEISIRIPPLRERVGDVLLLARAFLERFSEQHGNKIKSFSKDAIAALEGYHWPGNVRELENRVKRAVIMAEGKQISARDLELGGDNANDAQSFDLREIREQAERQAILRAMNHSGGKISQAAELLGVSRPTMYDLLKKYGLKT